MARSSAVTNCIFPAAIAFAFFLLYKASTSCKVFPGRSCSGFRLRAVIDSLGSDLASAIAASKLFALVGLLCFFSRRAFTTKIMFIPGLYG
ncbi:hypothetical protein MT325_m016R [Paramecium bursaria chlorella virus MT325]|uniref:Uncharacterized protein m016R n=1 Tax=Paramecium bursaria Chlorella virus MT325 TaxID=346932 RepID=A7IT96_PBCVM|nr:hypothetical protein MT325_m016R [Paramecium bursaria chlorella virus MT325]